VASLAERAAAIAAKIADRTGGAPDGFPRVAAGPGADAHRRIDEHLSAHVRPEDLGKQIVAKEDARLVRQSPTWQALVEGGPDELARTAATIVLRLAVMDVRWTEPRARPDGVHRSIGLLRDALAKIVARRLPFAEREILDLLEWAADRQRSVYPVQERDLVENAARLAADGGVPSPAVCEALQRLVPRLAHPWYGPPDRRLIDRIHEVAGSAAELAIDAGEAWADRAIADLGAAPDAERAAWTALAKLARDTDAAKPSATWWKNATPHLAALGDETFVARVLAWFPLVDRARTQPAERANEYSPDPNRMIGDANSSVLRGLVWACSRVPTPDVQRALAALAVSSFRKVPLIGPRCVKLGNACLNVLGEIGTKDAVGRLAYVRARTKLPQVAKKVDAALAAAAERAGVSVEDLEEMAVPDCGLTEVGGATVVLAGATARVVVRSTSDVAVEWTTADGKRPKSVPAKVKAEAAEELAELKGAVKDVERMLPTLRDAIDRLYLRPRTWDLAAWRERYLDHPLVGVHARRLIWTFTSGDRRSDAVFHEGRLVDAAGADVVPAADARVALWHPMGAPPADVQAWRDRLEALGIVQPFKQAHREVYLLTPAERETRVYSNRFAGHILRQHQFHALCAARGWRNQLRLATDNDYLAPSRELPAWGLLAEFWVDGVSTRNDADLLESGAFVHLATDQVRFYRAGAQGSVAHAFGQHHAAPDPVPLEEVPPLVLSEVMRDVDLFVGVTSVGNDPTWRDAGAEGAAQAYWVRWSFGPLEQTAETRRSVLQKLVPRLRIADRCSFDDRFLRVRGSRGAYRIHLGSGNVMMEPGDRYLCIVADRGSRAVGDVRLPFEGDATLSIVLSKAFLLAADDKITDPSILAQLAPA
jgi:hypothetical protein